jgi:hypothetical protein
VYSCYKPRDLLIHNNCNLVYKFSLKHQRIKVYGDGFKVYSVHPTQCARSRMYVITWTKICFPSFLVLYVLFHFPFLLKKYISATFIKSKVIRVEQTWLCFHNECSHLHPCTSKETNGKQFYFFLFTLKP